MSIERERGPRGLAGSTTIGVVIVDDHPLYRYALEQVLGRDRAIELLETFDDGESAVPGIRRLRPTVALIDVALPMLDGVGVVTALAGEELPTRMLALSGAVDGDRVWSALKAGAAGFVSKDMPAEELLRAVKAVAAGRMVLSPQAQEAIAGQIRGGVGGSDPLTGREKEIVALCAEGIGRHEIARSLHVSPATVKAHLAQVYRKLGVSGQVAAVATALRRGLVE